MSEVMFDFIELQVAQELECLNGKYYEFYAMFV